MHTSCARALRFELFAYALLRIPIDPHVVNVAARLAELLPRRKSD